MNPTNLSNKYLRKLISFRDIKRKQHKVTFHPLCVYVCVRAHAHILAQLCLTLCDPMDSSPPGSSLHGILQARILEWVAISSSQGSSDTGIKPTSHVSCTDKQILYHWCHLRSLLTPCAVLSRLAVSKQEYCSGLPCPSPWNLLNAETEPRSPIVQVDSFTG